MVLYYYIHVIRKTGQIGVVSLNPHSWLDCGSNHNANAVFTSCWVLVASCRTEFHPWEWWSWRHRCTARPPPAAGSQPPPQTPWTMAKLTVNNGVHITAPWTMVNNGVHITGPWTMAKLTVNNGVHITAPWTMAKLMVNNGLHYILYPGQWPNWRLIMVSTTSCIPDNGQTDG